MMEEEWRTSESSGWLLERARRGPAWATKARTRKYRLVAVTILREFLVHYPDPRIEPIVEAFELWCEGALTTDAFRAELQNCPVTHHADRPNWRHVAQSLNHSEPIDCARAAASQTQRRPRAANSERPDYGPWQEFVAIQCRIIRDIFGNPFRPVAFAPEWRTDTVTAIAREMYESREFSAMPILADALQDAGCDSDDILNHCRDPQQVHVRGCWVVDLVLGKS